MNSTKLISPVATNETKSIIGKSVNIPIATPKDKPVIVPTELIYNEQCNDHSPDEPRQLIQSHIVDMDLTKYIM
ncbi:MAG: hypothetical protein Faunusvirus15_5 [Faunusvirus sp.]|jgi:hypothetical protein|uniref:Uncharacterized protein n=1 Tax=Faunusvirus sp. TaxID=2487766 RepID=A0A3G4ZYQ3_9VIRU|nr:MAG: hypothetical protein Faunusvirus15_5 [Faunusvirus sp.]